jgi:integrase
MRIAEVKYLTWDDVNIEHKVLYVRDKKIEGKRKLTWKPKTGDHRIVPLSPNLVELFGRLPRRNSPWVFTRPSRQSEKPGLQPINDRSVLTHLKRILKRLKLPGHVHTFRHSFISHALIRGVPEALVRQWVGHVDPLTIRSYTHIADRDSHAQIERLFEPHRQAGSTPAPELQI